MNIKTIESLHLMSKMKSMNFVNTLMHKVLIEFTFLKIEISKMQFHFLEIKTNLFI